MIELKIDSEFRDKIPPLTDAEFEQLRENIHNSKNVCAREIIKYYNKGRKNRLDETAV